MTIASPHEVLKFWASAGPSKWWKKDAYFDASIAEQFTATLEAASKGELDDWAQEPDSALALVIVMDQFSRNLYRNDPRAFAQDEASGKIVKDAIESGLDVKITGDLNSFFYMPLMHSEDLEDQRLCLAQMQKVNAEGNIKAAKEHLEIIEKFGRFPHRNAVLGRQTTQDEQAFLDGGGFAG